MEFMEQGMIGIPSIEFPDVIPLEIQAQDHRVHTDVPDTAPEDEAPSLPKPKPEPEAPASPPATTTTTTTAPPTTPSP